VVLIAAAGNESTSNKSYPAAYPYVIGVSATDTNDALASFSNFGDYIDFAAPGVGIQAPGSATDSIYCVANGTSVASPIVAGLAAVLLGQDPSRTPDDIESLMRRTADDLGIAGWDPQFGYGRVNMYRALTLNANIPPAGRDLAYVYPNPFSPAQDLEGMRIVIKASPGDVVGVEVFDVLGNRVWSKSFSAQETGTRDFYYDPVVWNGKDEQGRELANGVYLARIKVNEQRIIKKIVLAR